MSTHNLCFEQKYEKYQRFLSENFQLFGVKFSIYLNRHVFVMSKLGYFGDIFLIFYKNGLLSVIIRIASISYEHTQHA